MTAIKKAFLALTLFSLSACGAAHRGVEAGDQRPLDVSAFYPMNEGATWAYDIDTGGGEPPTLGIYRVELVDGARRTIRPFRQLPVAYELRTEGIWRVASDTWLLRAPLSLGESWSAPSGRVARISAVDVVLETRAGRFEGCVEVREEGGDSELATRTVFCPEVGPVLVEASQALRLVMRPVVTVGRLRSYDPGPGLE